MRADRLLSLLMLLQSRGKTTAARLARELEVSERTIYRDVQALTTMGVPVYADSGPGAESRCWAATGRASPASPSASCARS